MTHLNQKKLYTWPILNVKSMDKGSFSGLASTFDVDQVKDQILPGAFKKTLNDWKKVKGYFPYIYHEHQPYDFLGIGTLLTETEKGLYIEGQLLIDHLPMAKRIYEDLIHGKNYGLSIGFYDKKSTMSGHIRTISEVDLVEISVVSHPCNPGAKIYELKRDHDPTNSSTMHSLEQLIACLQKKI